MVEQMDIHMDKSDHETRPMADAIFLLRNFPENLGISANLEERFWAVLFMESSKYGLFTV